MSEDTNNIFAFKHPGLYMYYHVLYKGIQVGTLAGVGMFGLRAASHIYQNMKNNEVDDDDNTENFYKKWLGILQRCVFHGGMHAMIVGTAICTYHYFQMNHDILVDRVHRIYYCKGSFEPNLYSSIGAILAVLSSFFITTYDPTHDPFVPKTKLEQVITHNEPSKDRLYKEIFSFSWVNPYIRHYTSHALIGVSIGMTLLVLKGWRLPVKKIIGYTMNCIN